MNYLLRKWTETKKNDVSDGQLLSEVEVYVYSPMIISVRVWQMMWQIMNSLEDQLNWIMNHATEKFVNICVLVFVIA